MHNNVVVEFQTEVIAFRSAELSSIITSDGPNCGPSPKKALLGKIKLRYFKPVVMVSSRSSDATITPNGTGPAGITVDSKKMNYIDGQKMMLHLQMQYLEIASHVHVLVA